MSHTVQKRPVLFQLKYAKCSSNKTLQYTRRLVRNETRGGNLLLRGT